MSRHERLPLPPAEPVVAEPSDSVGPTSASAAPVEAGPVGATPRKGRGRAILGLVALVALGAGGWEAREYWTTGRFMTETDDAYVDADITLIASRVQGYVAEVAVDANDRVEAGQVLVRLDDGDARNALQVARSRVESAGQTLARIDAQVEAAQAAVAQAEAGLDAARAQLRAATSTADRTRALADSNVAAQAQLDAATEGLDTATAGVAQARAGVTSAQAQVAVLRAQRAEAEGARRELQLAAEQAERDLDLTVLRAPASGTVANLALEVGDLVAPGTRLAALVPTDGLYVEANFKETQMEGVAPGSVAHLTFDALPGQEFEGRVASAAPATGSVFSLLPADNATGNFTKVVQRVPVRVEIPAEAVATGQLRAGLSTTVEIDGRTAPARLEAQDGPAAPVPVADAAGLAPAE